MKCSYLAIEREYGSGGTEIARRLAETCGIPCYGPEILEGVSRKYGIPTERLERYEETVSGSFLYTVFVLGRSQSGNPDLLTEEGHVFLAEQEEIRRLAAEGPAVFLGHCASEALRERTGVITAFIRADSGEKQHRIVSEYRIPQENAESTRKKFDTKRSKYYYANTTKHWNDLRNYDVVLDSSKLGIEGCVSILRGLFS